MEIVQYLLDHWDKLILFLSSFYLSTFYFSLSFFYIVTLICKLVSNSFKISTFQLQTHHPCQHPSTNDWPQIPSLSPPCLLSKLFGFNLLTIFWVTLTLKYIVTFLQVIYANKNAYTRFFKSMCFELFIVFIFSKMPFSVQ